jgi:hypothetical protein
MEFSREESDVISALVAKGMPPANATVATVMATRTTGRAREQLVDFVLTGYPGLEDRNVTSAAVQQLLESGWLREEDSADSRQCHAAPSIFSLMEAYVGDADLVRRVATLRSAQSPQVEVLGPIYDDAVQLRFGRAISGASKIIRLPLLATPATFEFAGALEERARRGVRLQILLASPDVVAALRGEPQRRRAEESVKGWTTLTRAWPHTDLRIMRSPKEAALAATSSFDDGRAFLVVYDIRRQRSQQSTVLDISQPGFVPNIVAIYNRAFDDAWRRARPVRGPRLIAWWLERMTWQVTFVVTVFVASASSNSTVSNVAAGIAGTALLTLAVRFRTAAGGLLARLRGR